MIHSQRWFDRKFALRLAASEFQPILERLRGTPSRVATLVGMLPSAVLVQRPVDRWSIQEHVGHLLDLEPLWRGRLEDLLLGAERLEAADLQNRKTHEACHNECRMADLQNRFCAARSELVARLEGVKESQLALEALHPRLNEPMNVTGLCFFVAEHDDHHLAAIESLISGEPGATR